MLWKEKKPTILVPFSPVLDDSHLFGSFFAGPSWTHWKKVWRKVETENIQQLFVCKGRGSGGSFMLAARAVYACGFVDWTAFLAPGGVATSLLLASDTRQASETFGYANGLVEAVPMLKSMVIRKTQSMIEFSNRTRIEVRVSNFRKVRGYSLSFAGMDELAFWQDQATGANPAKHVYDALLPALGRLPGSFLMAVSTPWSASGFFPDMVRKHLGSVA